LAADVELRGVKRAMTHDRADRGVQERLHLVRENDGLIAVAVGKAMSRLGHDDVVVLVLDTRDSVARDLAQVLVERSTDLNLDHEEARILAKRDMVPTGIAVIPLAAARAGFSVSHPMIADGLGATPPEGRVRVVVVAAGGATLVHLPLAKLAGGGSA
jgi:hypothetical protein